MAKYDLERLGAFGFQDVAAALAIAEFGPHIRRLGRGKDGGRDMETRSPVIWAKTEDRRREVWEGHTVFQVKHHERSRGNDVAVFWSAIKEELEKWADPDTNRGQVPNNLVFVSNVFLSPQPGDGGLAKVETNVKNWFADLKNRDLDPGGKASRERSVRRQRMSRVEHWRVWDGNQIVGLLDANDAVRRAFDGFLTAGDVLASLKGLSDTLPASELEPALQGHAREALIQQRMLYFDEAGADGPGVPVDQIVIDLPVRRHETGERARAIRSVLDRGEHVLRPSVCTIDKPRHLVITGAPGNGKTTASRFLVQAYRASLLRDHGRLGEDHLNTITGTGKRLEHLQRSLPRHRRWPVRVDLAKFAKRYAKGRLSLLSWIAEEISAESNTQILKPWALTEWMKSWPWIVICDGLDEVSEPDVRSWVIGSIHALIAAAEADDCDLFVVVTTRPTGYTDEMPPETFERLDLDDLTTAEAIAYGRTLTSVRIRTEKSRRERVEQLLAEAAADDKLRHLLRTPLQVQIMTIIAEGAGQFDPDRYSLFWNYYDTVVRREQRKETRAAQLLRDQAQQVLELHERVGLELQKRSESAGGATASLPERDLSDAAWRVLEQEGYKPGGADAELLKRIVQAATHRLVLLAPREDGYGFDVRSLQELMAARRLTTGALEDKIARLRVLAPSPHWRNTWVFAAGRLFAEPHQHEHEALVDLVETVDDGVDGRFAPIFPVGVALAWDLLDDGMAASRPRWMERLINHGLQALRLPAPQNVESFVHTLVRLSERSMPLRDQFRDGIREALAGDPTTRANTMALQEMIERDVPFGGPNDVALLSRLKATPGRSVLQGTAPDWDEFEQVVATFSTDPATETPIGAAAQVIRQHRGRDRTDAVPPTLLDALAYPEVAQIIELAVEPIARGEHGVIHVLRFAAERIVARQPVADQLALDLT